MTKAEPLEEGWRREFEIHNRGHDYWAVPGDIGTMRQGRIVVRYRFELPTLEQPRVAEAVEAAEGGFYLMLPSTLRESLERGAARLNVVATPARMLHWQQDSSNPNRLLVPRRSQRPGRHTLRVELRDRFDGDLLKAQAIDVVFYRVEHADYDSGECVPTGEMGLCEVIPVWGSDTERLAVDRQGFLLRQVHVSGRPWLPAGLLLLAFMLAFLIGRQRLTAQPIAAIAVLADESDYRGNRGWQVIPIKGDALVSQISPALKKAVGLIRKGVLSSGGILVCSDGSSTWKCWRLSLDCPEIAVCDGGAEYVLLSKARADALRRSGSNTSPSIKPPEGVPGGPMKPQRPGPWAPTRWGYVLGGPLAALALLVTLQAFFPSLGMTLSTAFVLVAAGMASGSLARFRPYKREHIS